MKRKLILPLLFIFLSSSLFSQAIQGVANYKIKLGEDWFFFDAKLLFNNHQSYFVWKQSSQAKRKIFKTISGDRLTQEVLSDTIGHIVFKDLANNYLLVRDFCHAKHPLLYKDSVKIKWEIQKTTKKVQGLDCQLATCRFRGRDYKAWFSPKIAVPYGPWKFGNLPGLIVEMADSQQEVEIQLKALDLNASANFDTQLKGAKTNLKKFTACMDKEWEAGCKKTEAFFAKMRAENPDLEIELTKAERRAATELSFED